MAHDDSQTPGVGRAPATSDCDRSHAAIEYELEAKQQAAVAEIEAALDHDVGDDLLSLMFTACHPVLSAEARVALTLRLLCGLSTREIARAFLVPEPTMAQRIVRAKKNLAQAGVPFEVPRGPDRAARLGSVLQRSRTELPHPWPPPGYRGGFFC